MGRSRPQKHGAQHYTPPHCTLIPWEKTQNHKCCRFVEAYVVFAFRDTTWSPMSPSFVVKRRKKFRLFRLWPISTKNERRHGLLPVMKKYLALLVWGPYTKSGCLDCKAVYLLLEKQHHWQPKLRFLERVHPYPSLDPSKALIKHILWWRWREIGYKAPFSCCSGDGKW